jgi:hypothetical protein
MRQNHRSALPGGQTGEAPRLERRIRHAYLFAADALPCRPEPRAAFDNVARAEVPRSPWRAFGVPLRAVCAAAAAIGGPVVDVVRERVLTTVLDFAAWVLEPLAGEHSVAEMLYTRVVREQAEALEAQATHRGLGTETAREHALAETEEAIVAQQLYTVTLRRESREPARWSARRAPVTYGAPQHARTGALR